MTAVFEDEYRLRCTRCAGCGRIASTEDGEPWSWWDELPQGSNAAVLMGVVYPLACPTCEGRGYIVPDAKTAAALDDVIAAAMRRLDRGGVMAMGRGRAEAMSDEVRDYDALWNVPSVLMDQVHHAHVRPDTQQHERFLGEQWAIVGHSESDRLLFTAHGFPSAEYAQQHCRHADIPVQAAEEAR